ncbi:hypothetical protein KQI82_08555 [Oscillibacter sp. MSJ-2]|uniref:Sodium:glutamate symporter n=1 Tax=Dysosmobacter acutus TaxID=2841504 RepID=A0ABS6F9I7_9FIRM|nr:hypothetical protein [Dysosmobacter acutus]MBU5626956.1 hypothetical protein [Dysosmobacter acutus]
MLPVEKIASGTITNFILYLAIIGILLFVATVLRLKINFLKKAFIPASLIAGIIGLILGPYVLGLFSAEMRSSLSAMPTPFIVIVFACMQLGVKRSNLKDALILSAPSVIQGYLYSFVQVGVTCLLTALLFTPLWGTNSIFGCIVEVGFEGGHGTAGGMTEVYAELGWAAGGDVGQTTATIGLIIAIVGGIILINMGVKRRYTTVLEDSSALNAGQETFTGGEKKPSTYTTISGNVVETFAFHAALIGIAIFIGKVIIYLFDLVFHYSLPLFPFAMIGGWLLNMVLQRTPLAELMDRGIFVHIQSLTMDFLIVAAVASVSIPVILENWKPLLISCTLVTAIIIWLFWWTSPRLYKKHWFECAITRFGVATGVAAIGLMLLRTCDPEMKTEAGTVYGLGTPFVSPFVGGGLITTAYPYLIVAMGALKCGLLFVGISIALILLCMLVGLWNRKPVMEQRGNL